ncbi:hypothetical protein KPATCC21470_2960 [Kitasatospora purpeofusca]
MAPGWGRTGPGRDCLRDPREADRRPARRRAVLRSYDVARPGPVARRPAPIQCLFPIE